MSAVLRSPPVSRLPSPGPLVAWCVAVFLIAAALLPLAPQLTVPGEPLTLEISGEFERVPPAAVHRALAAALHADFHRLDLAAVKAAAEALPWVAEARIARSWPGTVRVEIREHRAYARWNGDALLAESGAVFMPGPRDQSRGEPLAADLPAGLPRLAGPAGQEALVYAAFALLREELAATPFPLQGLTLDERGEWTAVTADGIELKLGRGALPELAQRTVATLGGPVATALQGRFQEVAYVDLHYINGFAVGWRGDRSGLGNGPGGDAPRGHE